MYGVSKYGSVQYGGTGSPKGIVYAVKTFVWDLSGGISKQLDFL